MTTPQALLDLIHSSHLNESEFEQVILSHFAGAQHISQDVVVYPSSENGYALKLIYENGNIVRIEAGPGLNDGDVATLIERVKDELVVTAGTKVGAVILFAPVPVSGSFRHSDIFQILPVPPDAPRPRFIIADHPFLLEFRFMASAHWPLNISRRAVIGREIELFLAGIVEGAIYSTGFSPGHHWVMTSEGVDPLTIAYCQEMYTAPGILLQRDTFSSLDGLPAFAQSDPTQYYSREGISAERVLELPSTFVSLFDTFNQLPSADHRRFLTSCFWFQHANRVFRHSRSAYFTALISAIEALIPPSTAHSQCSECKRSMGPGPTEQFALFLEQFAAGAGELKRERKRLYGIRSALSHGGALLRSDYRTWSPGMPPAGVKEWDDLRAAWRVVRIALVNWLTAQRITH